MWPPDDLEFARIDIAAGGNERIAALRSSLTCIKQPHGVVVLPPGYERMIHHYAALSFLLAVEGYITLRFDFRNHLGLSDGVIEDFSMSSAASDVSHVVCYVQETFESLPIFVLAPSMAARVAIRALSETPSPAGLMTLMPVVDLRYSLAQLAGEDLLERWERREETDGSQLYKISNYDVKAGFAEDALLRKWDSLGSTIEELRAVNCPVCAVVADKDEWVRPDDVTLALDDGSDVPRRCTIIEASSHDVGRNLPVMRLLMELAVQGINDFCGLDTRVAVPEFSELVRIFTTERRWARKGYDTLPSPVTQVIT